LEEEVLGRDMMGKGKLKIGDKAES